MKEDARSVPCRAVAAARGLASSILAEPRKYLRHHTTVRLVVAGDLCDQRVRRERDNLLYRFMCRGPRSDHGTKPIGWSVRPTGGDETGGVHRLGDRLQPEVEGAGNRDRLRPDHPVEHVEPGEWCGPRNIPVAAARSVVRVLEVGRLSGRPV